MAPVAKVGGLGDVVTALARAVQEEGHLVEVVLPRCVGVCVLGAWCLQLVSVGWLIYGFVGSSC
jgi:hypothetical protein